MAANEKTQALIAELEAPTRATCADGESLILTIIESVATLSQQAERDLTLAQIAEVAETDEELRGKFESIVQTARAKQRICGELVRHARDLLTTVRQRERYTAELCPKAAELGYQVTAAPPVQLEAAAVGSD